MPLVVNMRLGETLDLGTVKVTVCEKNGKRVKLIVEGADHVSVRRDLPKPEDKAQ